MKTLDHIEFSKAIELIELKQLQGQDLTLFELFLEACNNYNKALIEKNETDKAYYEGKKNAYQEVIELLEKQIK